MSLCIVVEQTLGGVGTGCLAAQLHTLAPQSLRYGLAFWQMEMDEGGDKQLASAGAGDEPVLPGTVSSFLRFQAGTPLL